MSKARDLGTYAGKVLQVVQTVKTDTFSYTTGDAWGDITGLSVNITPVSTSNKILVSIDVSCNTQNLSYLKILRDSTDIAIGDAAGSRVRSTIANIHRFDNNSNVTANWSQRFLDSPSTTSEITYKIQVYNETVGIGQVFYLNRTASDGDSDVAGRPISTITVMEIAG